MNNILLYGHGGAYNHGAEAILVTTIDCIRNRVPKIRIGLSTHFKEQDIEFGIDTDEYFTRDEKYVALENITSHVDYMMLKFISQQLRRPHQIPWLYL